MGMKKKWGDDKVIRVNRVRIVPNLIEMSLFIYSLLLPAALLGSVPKNCGHQKIVDYHRRNCAGCTLPLLPVALALPRFYIYDTRQRPYRKRA